MRVLMLDPSGSNPYGTDLCNALHDAGLTLRALVAKGYLHRQRARAEFREVAPRSCSGRKVLKAFEELDYLRTIADSFGRWKPDIVHVQWIRLWPELGLLRYLRKRGGAIVITAHNPLPHELDPDDFGFHGRLYRAADRIIVHNNSGKDTLESVHGLPPGGIDVIPHGVSQLERQRLLDSNAARDRLGLPQDAVVFLFYGSVREYKGYRELIRAFRNAAARAPLAWLVMAGWGRAETIAFLTQKVASWPDSVRNRTLLLLRSEGFLSEEETDALFAACDCVVLPYRDISQSGVLAQALSYGRSVIATAVGGFIETVLDGVTGVLVPPKDPLALEGALVRLSERKPDLHEWGSRGRASALAHASWRTVANRTADSYAKALLERSAGHA